MDNIRIAILSPYDEVCTYMDNRAPKAIHYYDDKLHEYLKGTANTYTFKTDAKHEDSVHLTEGNKLSFRYRKKDYYLNIMSVRRNEYVVEVEAYSLNFELLNEHKAAYKAANAMTFEQYLSVFDYEKVVTVIINEVSTKSIKNEWTGTDTMLARLYSLGNLFGAEIEFIPKLNDDYSLDKIILNVYQAHTDTVQGVGTDRSDRVLRFGKNIKGVTKTSDITELYTLIYPFGKDGLTVASLDKTEYDSEGRIEYHSPAGDRNIYAVLARDRFPSNTTTHVNNRYIARPWDYNTDNVNVLYGQALAELKKNCVPQVKYEVDGYFDTNIGDTVTIADDEFNPPLYLRARVTEQFRSFTDPSQNKTTFDNFKELQSEIDPSLLSAMNALIEANKMYTCSILSDNGIVFKNGVGSTMLTASVRDGSKDMTDNITINWTRDGTYIYTGKSITILASGIVGKSVFRFEAIDSVGTVKGTYEVTVSSLYDGADGEPGPPGEKGETGAIGPKGNDGAKGDPTGITVSATEPSSKYTGMLWQHTGTVAGLIKGATYCWTGSAWTLYNFSAANISVDKLSAFTADIGDMTAGNIRNTTGTMQMDIRNGIIETHNAGTDDYATFSNASIVFETGDIFAGGKLTEYTKDGITHQTGPLDISTTTLKFIVKGAEQYGDLDIDGFRVRASIMNRAPTNHASAGTGYGVGTIANYGHVKTRNDLNASSYVTGESLSSYQGYLLNNKITSLCTSVVTKGRVTVQCTNSTWLNIAAVPSYNSGNRYYCIVNCSTVPLSGYVRNDGRIIAYGPTVFNGTSYTVDYLVFIS